MDDISTLRSTRSNYSFRMDRDRDASTLRIAASYPSMRGDIDQEDIVQTKRQSHRPSKRGSKVQSPVSDEVIPELLVGDVPGSVPPPQGPMARKIYAKATMGGTMMIIIIIFGIFAVYWGALSKVSTNGHKLVGWVVDFDGGMIGNSVTSAVQQLPHAPQLMTWVVKDASEFPGGPSDLANRVHQQDVWFAVSINPGSSDALAAALASPGNHTNYNGSLAITGYGEEARNDNGYKIFVPQFQNMIIPIIAKFTNDFSVRNVSTLSASNAVNVLREAPQIANRPIYFTVQNLRPFNISIATAMTFVGLIFVLVLAFLLVLITQGARLASGLENSLSTRRLIAVRIMTPLVIYFFLSLFYSLLSLAFQANFNRHFGKAGFVIYWMLHYVGMLALGFALETMLNVLTLKGLPAFLVLWILSNVSVASVPIDLLPGVYRYGYAMPFFNISEGARVILFGTKNTLGLNFGILFAWTGLSLITLPLSIIVTRHLARRSADKAAQQPQAPIQAQVKEVEPMTMDIVAHSHGNHGLREPKALES